jgi:hypothetical protein
MKSSKFNKMYDMYNSINDMDMKVFNIYHDWMYDVLQESYDVEDDDDDYSDKLFNRMKSLQLSAKHMNDAIG